MSRARPSAEDILAQQLHVAAALQRQLEAEHQALQGREPAVLERISAEKMQLAAELDRLEQRRLTLSHTGRTAAERPAALLAALEDCARQNRINGMLIEAGRRRTQAALDILRGGASGTALYGADGETKTPATRSRLASA